MSESQLSPIYCFLQSSVSTAPASPWICDCAPTWPVCPGCAPAPVPSQPSTASPGTWSQTAGRTSPTAWPRRWRSTRASSVAWTATEELRLSWRGNSHGWPDLLLFHFWSCCSRTYCCTGLGYVLQQMDHFLYCRILHNLMNNDGGKPKEKEDCATAENLESVS